jgi:hypothetical protein
MKEYIKFINLIIISFKYGKEFTLQRRGGGGSRAAKSHGLAVSLQVSALTSRSHGWS